MEKVEGLFFDGHTSKPNKVWVKLQPGNLLYIYPYEEGFGAIEQWDITNCKKESFNSSNSMQISYQKDEIRQMLEIPNLSSKLKNAFKEERFNEIALFDRVLSGNVLKVMITSIAALALLVFLYTQYISVYVGNAIVSIIPISVEESIGVRAFHQYYTFLDLDDDKTELLNEFYEELGYPSEYNIEVYYDISEQVNAFAMPGGKIVVYEGLIKKTESWQELAALFGHELSHVNQRHTMHLMSRELGNYAVFSAITGDMAGISSVIIESAISMNELQYSRKYEKEADLKGLHLMLDAGIDPSAMIGLFQRLKDENEEVEEFLESLEMLSTHPLTDLRMKYIEEWLLYNELPEFEEEKFSRAKEIWEELQKD